MNVDGTGTNIQKNGCVCEGVLRDHTRRWYVGFSKCIGNCIAEVAQLGGMFKGQKLNFGKDTKVRIIKLLLRGLMVEIFILAVVEV